MKNPRVKEVSPCSDYTLKLIFTNGEKKLFDVKPYLDKGIFQKLRDQAIFHSVLIYEGSICWPGGQDFGPDTLYLEGRGL